VSSAWTIAEVDPQRFAHEIRAARLDLLEGWGVTEQSYGPRLLPVFASILPDAAYIALSPADGSLAGFTEYYSWGERGTASAPFANWFDLRTVAPPHLIAHIRSIYLQPEHRRHFGLYVKLYATTARHALARGFTHTTLITWSGAHDVRALYRRMNAQLICTFEIAGLPRSMEAYLIDLRDLVVQPFAARFASPQVASATS
jgi:hypothetical protein